jgi:hypothetical protein
VYIQHVDYLRLPPKQPQPPKSGEPRRHPAPTDYRRKKPISTVNPTQSSHPETPAGVNPDLIEIKDKEDVDEEVDEVVGKKKGGEKVMVAVDEDDIDWFAYYLAVSPHLLIGRPVSLIQHPTPSITRKSPTTSQFLTPSPYPLPSQPLPNSPWPGSNPPPRDYTQPPGPVHGRC